MDETIWLAIYSNEMMASDFITFLEFLNINDMKYTSYHGLEDDEIFINVTGNMTDIFNKQLSAITYYQSIIQIEEPEYSDIDLIEEMSNT